MSGLSTAPQGSQRKAGFLSFQTILVDFAQHLYWILWLVFTFLYNPGMLPYSSRGKGSRASPRQLQPWAGVTSAEALKQPHEEELPHRDASWRWWDSRSPAEGTLQQSCVQHPGPSKGEVRHRGWGFSSTGRPILILSLANSFPWLPKTCEKEKKRA